MSRIPELDRRDSIVYAAVLMARKHGFTEFTRDQVAAEAQCSTGCVSKYYDTTALRHAVLKYAVKVRDWDLMGNLLVGPYAGALRLPKDLRAELARRVAK